MIHKLIGIQKRNIILQLEKLSGKNISKQRLPLFKELHKSD